jgi:hypothetical protein
MAKRALCIGINDYPGTGMDLQGCVNDVADWAGELESRGFAVERLVDAQATKAAMVDALSRTIGQAQAGDVVVLTFSGHGTCVPDLDGDEIDALDEGLCPHDLHATGEALLDDEIGELFARRAPGVRLVMISDSCHSGTVTRAALPDPDAEGPRVRFLPMGNWLAAERLPSGARGRASNGTAAPRGESPLRRAMSRRQGDLLLAGCREGANHFSYDARIAGRYNGAFTYYALKALRALPADASYAQWHAAIAERLPSASYPQSPQIVGSSRARSHPVFD